MHPIPTQPFILHDTQWYKRQTISISILYFIFTAYIPLESATLKEGNGAYKYHHQYKLPDGLQGELILIQWYYVTANSW